MSTINTDVLKQEWSDTLDAIKDAFTKSCHYMDAILADKMEAAFVLSYADSAVSYRKAAAWLISVEGGQSALSRRMELIAARLQKLAEGKNAA